MHTAAPEAVQPTVTVTRDADMEAPLLQAPAPTAKQKKPQGKQNKRMTVNSLADIVFDMRNDQGSCSNRVHSLEHHVKGIGEQLQLLINMNLEQQRSQSGPSAPVQGHVPSVTVPTAPPSVTLPTVTPSVVIPTAPIASHSTGQGQASASEISVVTQNNNTCANSSFVPAVNLTHTTPAQPGPAALARHCPLPPPAELVGNRITRAV